MMAPAGILVLSIAVAGTVILPTVAAAQGKVYAKIDGRDITELGPNLAQVPEAQRTIVLLQYLIENSLLSGAGDKAGLGTGGDFDKRLAYYKTRALRDAFFDKNVFGAVTEADAKAVFDKKVAEIPPVEELRAAHILVEKKEEADDIAAKLKAGGDFAALAKEKSKDTGSGANGGELGFFAKGQMVPEFEAAAYALKPGEISAPVKTQFGWHVIKLEEKRNKPLPEFASVKERILTDLQQKKAEEIVSGLRKAAKIEYVDEAIKKQMDAMMPPEAMAPAGGTAPAADGATPTPDAAAPKTP
jgi:peptidyl-prolyl cis-trans isomerase C